MTLRKFLSVSTVSLVLAVPVALAAPVSAEASAGYRAPQWCLYKASAWYIRAAVPRHRYIFIDGSRHSNGSAWRQCAYRGSGVLMPYWRRVAWGWA